MKESYFNLSTNEQQDLLKYCANKLSMRPLLIEKDIWLCWVLDIIFNLKDKKPMAFKGGTSLSKVFNAINRFSEDVDITLDHRGFDISDELFKVSTSQQRKISDKLKVKVKEYSNDVIIPTLSSSMSTISQHYRLEIDELGEKIKLWYPSAISTPDNSNKYIKECVLIELGGRNTIDPNDIHTIKPYMADKIPELIFPEPKVTVLSPQRTFWEKATLIHVECHRGVRQNAERLSRHWYDLVKLYENDNIGKSAINDHSLLQNVVEYKTIFFNASYANYNECLNKNFTLIPNDSGIIELKKDYNQMYHSGMIYDADNYPFEYIIYRIKEIMEKINS